MTAPAACRQFSWEDQRIFARLSGDFNPIHMDPLAARRTSAGSPVVHGVHTLVWAIDQLAGAPRPAVNRLKVDWSHFVHVGEVAQLTVESETPARLRAQIRVGDEPVATITLHFGARIPASEPGANSSLPEVPPSQELAECDWNSLAGQLGVIEFASSPGAVARCFPRAAAWLGAPRIVALLTLSRLVGMVCPGLHSIFARLDLKLVDEDSRDAICYQVAGLDERFRYITQKVHGGGISGIVEAFVRSAPVAQPEMDQLSEIVRPDEFRDSVSLVIGGSRGLGELTAKLLAAGGSRVAISYRSGLADADRVASSIRRAGRRCDTIHYDVLETASNQLASLGQQPTHVYYFATGPISPARTKPFDHPRFEEFCAFYVRGFSHLCACLPAGVQHPLRVFYPSSVYVSAADRPKGLAEYAMAKAAGEVLCEEINATCPQIQVTSRRLPRMLTDQTSGVGPAEDFAPASAVLLQAIRELHSR